VGQIDLVFSQCR